MADETLSFLADSILAHSVACLAGTTRGAPTEQFVSHNSPPWDCCDFVAVWVKLIRPTINFPTTSVLPAVCNDVSMAVDMAVLFMRDCYPEQTGTKGNPFPGSDAVNDAATDLLVDARTLWCCLRSANNDDVLIPFEGFDVIFGNMTPSRGGGCAGWQIDFTVEAPGCCWPYGGSGS